MLRHTDAMYIDIPNHDIALFQALLQLSCDSISATVFRATTLKLRIF